MANDFDNGEPLDWHDKKLKTSIIICVAVAVVIILLILVCLLDPFFTSALPVFN
jgi:hypothetical protein